MSLQPLPPALQDILNRALRTQYVVLPATSSYFDNVNDEIDNAIISQFLQQPTIPILTPNILVNPTKKQTNEQQEIQQQEQQQQTDQQQASEQNQKKLTRAKALGLRLTLGFLGALLLILGLFAAISGDYLDNILSSIKDIFKQNNE